MRFGYLPENKKYETELFRIEPLAEIREAIESVNSEGLIHDGWFHPPVDDPPTSSKAPAKVPKIPQGAFGLPSTHKIIVNNGDDKEFCEFIINLFGFLKGLKLIPEEWFHFYRIAIKPNKLSGFHCADDEIKNILNLGTDFYIKNRNTKLNKLLFGAIHWHLFGPSYLHDFERFDSEYKVLDTCYKIAEEAYGIKSKNHTGRPVALCNQFNMPVPRWAKIENKSSYLSRLRNDLAHEALYANEPIGFGTPDPSIVFELKNLNSKFILGLLGVKAKYIQFPADKEFCLHALDMETSPNHTIKAD